ncbi:hypothetical protein ACFWBI_18710 [Streptomyces sp. NPDC059982]|uniref:hypothetical protein n=1 Tax=unclassified Streptomyces TaxID=2593676 RepID=UPI0036B34C84
MGYPELMSRSRACLAAGLFNVNEQKALGDLSRYVNGKQAGAVQGDQRVSYADPIPMFSGHGTCDDDEWIYAKVMEQKLRDIGYGAI